MKLGRLIDIDLELKGLRSAFNRTYKRIQDTKQEKQRLREVLDCAPSHAVCKLFEKECQRLANLVTRIEYITQRYNELLIERGEILKERKQYESFKLI